MVRRTYYFSRNRKHPNSYPSLFYTNALIQCDNNGCNQKVSLSNWYKHIRFNCDYRIVNCPAIECSVKRNPKDIITHSFQSRFHTVWCAECKINWTVLATGHNCDKSKKYNKLRGNDYHPPCYVEPNEDGAVFLKIILPIDKTFDNRALEQVDYLVSEYHYSDNIKQLVLATFGGVHRE